ncbi:hypothetical protein AX15_003827 [Amanita polypyramis BW_CC]|nr:hypothetical protein AX15_003827 [Amanita polypyramis BW_CC]
MFRVWIAVLLPLLVPPASPIATPTPNHRGISLPIVRGSPGSPTSRKRATSMHGAVGLGDYEDVAYNVLVTIGGLNLPLVLDTGSSDLWVTSDACLIDCNNTIKYHQTTFNSTGLEAHLYYGDSSSGTYAFGLIGTDTVSVAGLSLPQQYFVAINNTSTNVGGTGSSGIFGLGFPFNSVVFNDVLRAELSQPHTRSSEQPKSRKNDAQRQQLNVHPTKPSFSISTFPNLRHLSKMTSQSTTSTSVVDATLSPFATLGPFISRLVATNALSEPLFAITLQRDTIEIGGNAGVLSIGQLPANVKNESLTWVPIRGYAVDNGNLGAPVESPNEVYPIAWEVFLDDVYLDDEKLPRSELASPNITLSALVDTGNSIIRGPPDIVSYVTNKLGADFPCDEPHTLTFSIGGERFPVDPRDFIEQEYKNNVSWCTAKLLATNTPTIGGFLYSWSLGSPFLKRSVLQRTVYILLWEFELSFA